MIGIAVVRRRTHNVLHIGHFQRSVGRERRATIGIGLSIQYNFTHQFVNLFFQLAHPALSGILLNEKLRGGGRKLHLVRQIDVLQRIGNEVATGNLLFLLRQVSLYVNQFHTIAQRTRNSGEVIGGGDEQHLTQIVIKVKVVIMEGVVLFGIEQFEQRTLWVAIVV